MSEVTFAEEKKKKSQNFTHFIAGIAAVVIYTTLRCLLVVVTMSCMAYGFIVKLEIL